MPPKNPVSERVKRLESLLEKESSSINRNELKHYVCWRDMLLVISAACAVLVFLMPRLIAYETKTTDEKLDRILGIVTNSSQR